jgi:hypothetical protein
MTIGCKKIITFYLYFDLTNGIRDKFLDETIRTKTACKLLSNTPFKCCKMSVGGHTIFLKVFFNDTVHKSIFVTVVLKKMSNLDIKCFCTVMFNPFTPKKKKCSELAENLRRTSQKIIKNMSY